MPVRGEVRCAFCGSTNVAPLSMFGTAQLVSQYYCHRCKSVFERVRWRNDDKGKGEVIHED
ncbi:hypothetical protein B1691_16035 [Geobacillus sp. 47C-IIb]|uniref:PaaD-like zinc ribbon domain-containing protein n=1 Tax=Geobacillus TaxID=129337 RepID=UPI0009BDE89A|nr:MULTISPECIES: hypothetical protein [Geobacillus]ATO38889.1 hypothetical protein GTID1_17970 [Geobacillus thermodenitrificans]OQP08310.1 hypothetical protein B1691_16035 [Geobacillus sp. 47C-IIb]QNU31595.1 hypothetical protein IC804_01915 [Geobacillus sp. 47C-IIb]